MKGKLLHGDCLELMKKIPDGKIDAIITDPPYGTIACKWDSIIPFEPMWQELKRIIKPNGVIALFGSQPFTSALVMSNVKMFRYTWVWDKKKGGNPCLAKVQPIKVTEDVVVFSPSKGSYQPIMIDRETPKKRGKNKGKISEINNNAFVENKTYTQKYPKNILEFSNANQRDRLHPTQKPVELIEYLIKTYTNENEIVLDFTSGSGTTAIAAINTNRKYICIEKDDNYYRISKERIEKHLKDLEIKNVT